jgi:hypothetical protein
VFQGQETAAPETPLGLAAVPDGPATIAVSWSLARNAASYDLEADGILLTAVKSPFLHRGLAPASRHAYRVRSVNDGGTSAWSEPVTCATEKRPATSGK